MTGRAPANRPEPSSTNARNTMRANRRRDTQPELALRRALHAAGLRYRVDAPLAFDRRRRADIVFTGPKVAVFVDGCFWHGCFEHYSAPRSNAAFWSAKVRTNRDRDRDTDRRLQELGWAVVRVWEHETVDDALVERIRGPELSRR